MNWLKDIKENLDSELRTLVEASDRAKIARDGAPSAMESHSDTTRSEQEKLLFALDDEIIRVEDNLKKLEKSGKDWEEITVDNSGVPMKLVLVPEGMGGKKIGDVFLVSENAPLAM